MRSERARHSWIELNRANLHQAPRVWHDWLACPLSLTKYLGYKTSSQVQVSVIRDTRQSLSNDEIEIFNRPIHRCRVREVYLTVNATEVVYAKSIIPTISSTGLQRDVLQLGNTPLGEVLFRTKPPHIAFREMTEIRGLGWGRRTLYLLRGHPILIAEYFLPQLLHHIVR